MRALLYLVTSLLSPTAIHLGDVTETYRTQAPRNRGATLRWGGGTISASILGGGGGHKTLFLTNSL